MRNKKYDIPILAIVIVLMFTWAYGANYIIHDFTTGVMHEAKDVYRTNTRSVEDDMDSIEAKIPAGGSADATILAAHMADETTAHGETSENVASRIVTRDASGNFKAGTITGTLSGNASTATQLATPRTIAGTSFDGTANISISHTGLTDKGTLTHAQVENELTRLEIDKADTSAVALKANTADVYNTAAINLLLADKADTGSVTIVSGALASHTGEVSGAHQGSAIAVDSSGFTGNLTLADNTVQKALATLDALSGLPATNAITKIYGDADVDGCETGAVWLVGTNGVTVNRTSNTFEVDIDSATKFDDYYTQAQTNATIEAAIAAVNIKSEKLTNTGDNISFDSAYIMTTNECQIFLNGVMQWPEDDYYIDEDSGHSRIRFIVTTPDASKVFATMVR